MTSQQDEKIKPTLSGTSMERAKILLDNMTIEEKALELRFLSNRIFQTIELSSNRDIANRLQIKKDRGRILLTLKKKWDPNM